MIIYRCEDPNCLVESEVNKLRKVELVINEKKINAELCDESCQKLRELISIFFEKKPKPTSPSGAGANQPVVTSVK